MRTYIYQEIDSPLRGFNVRIVVHRVIKNQPILIGCSDHNTASWKGAHGEAVSVLHTSGREQYVKNTDGTVNTYALHGELNNAEKYDGRPGNCVRLFEI